MGVQYKLLLDGWVERGILIKHQRLHTETRVKSQHEEEIDSVWFPVQSEPESHTDMSSVPGEGVKG